ncbi:MAG: hypothetical protein P4M11_01945 [Candidatus Pacebacteria bacterium]|nr:hypothetical protein [Candidatus Paceibacterota bacterium]
MTELERILYNALSMIANDYVELSHDKIEWQRNDFMRRAKKAIENYHEFKEQIVNLQNEVESLKAQLATETRLRGIAETCLKREEDTVELLRSKNIRLKEAINSLYGIMGDEK